MEKRRASRARAGCSSSELGMHDSTEPLRGNGLLPRSKESDGMSVAAEPTRASAATVLAEKTDLVSTAEHRSQALFSRDLGGSERVLGRVARGMHGAEASRLSLTLRERTLTRSSEAEFCS